MLMNHLPEDPYMLVSAINFLLRDGICPDLDKVCYDYGLERGELEARLRRHGFEYNEAQKKFW